MQPGDGHQMADASAPIHLPVLGGDAALVAHGEGATVLHLALAIGYAAAYVTAVLALAVVAFERRELK